MSESDKILKKLEESDPMLAITAAIKLARQSLQKAEISRRDYDELNAMMGKISKRVKELQKNGIRKMQVPRLRLKI